VPATREDWVHTLGQSPTNFVGGGADLVAVTVVTPHFAADEISREAMKGPFAFSVTVEQTTVAEVYSPLFH
jgi:hypothetical protein